MDAKSFSNRVKEKYPDLQVNARVSYDGKNEKLEAQISWGALVDCSLPVDEDAFWQDFDHQIQAGLNRLLNGRNRERDGTGDVPAVEESTGG